MFFVTCLQFIAYTLYLFSFFSHRYNGTREDDIYYYPSVIAHDSDTTFSIIWMTIYKVNICFEQPT